MLAADFFYKCIGAWGSILLVLGVLLSFIIFPPLNLGRHHGISPVSNETTMLEYDVLIGSARDWEAYIVAVRVYLEQLIKQSIDPFCVPAYLPICAVFPIFPL